MPDQSKVDVAFLVPYARFELEWHKNPLSQWMYDNFYLCVILSVLYVVLVFAGQRFMAKREAFDLRGPLIAWNGFLTVLSWVMALRLAPALVQRIIHWDIVDTFCDRSFINGPTGFWMMIFSLSKVPELLDTAFLVLRKKPVILLHWYHHFTVLLYTWYSYMVDMPAGLWFGAMNSVVHAFMYFYYFETAQGKKPKWNMVLTLGQIIQMVIGSTISAYDLTRSAPCAPMIPLYTGLAMYFSYFCLFAHLFYQSYCTAKGQARRSKKPAAVAAVGTTDTKKSS